MEQLRRNSLAWLERTNPLRGLSISRAGCIFDNARVWGSPRLQYMYNEIEMTDPVLMTCVERRNAALAGLQQQFVAISGVDETLANEQRDALVRFVSQIENFDEALERMDEAFFRGYVHLQPIWDGDKVPYIRPINSWNFIRNDRGEWLWNPNCHETIAGLDDVRGARLVTLARRRAIDYPAIFIYIRKALGERDYGRFIERHGIPHAAIMMAPGTEKKDVPAYLSSADAWNNGQNMVLPNGASINLATEARGTDPFTPFVEHQDKYIVLLATGGTLTSLAQADTGSLAGGAQMEVWREIVARDGVLIAGALNRCLFNRYLNLAFPGQPIAAEFRLDNERKQSAAEVADLAGKLKAAGWRISQEQLEEAVGYTLEKDDGGQGLTALPSMVGRGVPSAPFMNKAGTNGTDVTNATACPNSILAAFARDTGPAADAIKELLKNPSKDAAESILKNLDSLLPQDPYLAAEIAEAMAKEFKVTGEDGRARAPREPQPNKDDQPRGKSSPESTPGSFAPAGGGGASTKGDEAKKEEPKIEESPKAKAKREKHEWQVKAAAQGTANMQIIRSGQDCHDFMPGPTLINGKKISHIAFYQSELIHVRDNMQGDFGNGKFGFNHQPMLVGDRIPNTIAQGTWYKQGADYVAVEGKDKLVVLSPDGDGVKFKTTRIAADDVSKIRAGNYQRVFNKEDADDESHSTNAGF